MSRIPAVIISPVGELDASAPNRLAVVPMTWGVHLMVLPSVHVLLGYAVLGALLARAGGLVRTADGTVVSAR